MNTARFLVADLLASADEVGVSNIEAKEISDMHFGAINQKQMR